jgi:hypothetical protein
MAKEVKLRMREEMQQMASFVFLHRYGYAVACWSRVEDSIYSWFELLTGMPDDMSRAIFYSGKGFMARADMVEAAIQADKKRSPQQIEFIKEALKKARTYSSFRNAIVHGNPLPTLTIESGPDVVEIQYSIGQAKSRYKAESDVTLEHLGVAGQNFTKLSRYMVAALPTTAAKHAKPPEECLALVLVLPSRPHDKSDPTGEEKPPQPEQPSRPNKKAYRAAQAAKKAGKKK